MVDFLYIFQAIVFWLLCWHVVDRFVHLGSPSTVGLLFLFYMLLIYPGCVYEVVINDFDSWSFAIAFQLFPVMLFLGSQSIRVLSMSRPLRVGGRYMLVDDFPAASTRMIWSLSLSIVILSGLSYLKSVGSIPLYLMLTTDLTTKELVELREASTTTLGGGESGRLFSYYMAAFKGVGFIVVAIAFVKWSLTRSKYWLGCLLLAGTTVFLLLLSNLMKFECVRLLIYLAIVHAALSRKSLLTMFAKVGVVGGSVIIFVALKVAFGHTDYSFAESLRFTLVGIIHRMFITWPDLLHLYFTHFPDYHEFLLGRSQPNPHGIFPWEWFPLAKYMFYVYKPHAYIVGSAPTTFFGQFYADFGFLGALLSMVFAGVLCGVVDALMGRSQKLSRVVVYLYVAMTISYISFSFFWVFLSWYFIAAVASGYGLVAAANWIAPDSRRRIVSMRRTV